MTTLTCEIQNDSKFIKILTTIAMFYTPASLMAVCSRYLHKRSDADSTFAPPGHLQLESRTDSGTSGCRWSNRLRLDQGILPFSLENVARVFVLLRFLTEFKGNAQTAIQMRTEMQHALYRTRCARR